jgi:hypothetical protein
MKFLDVLDFDCVLGAHDKNLIEVAAFGVVFNWPL